MGNPDGGQNRTSKDLAAAKTQRMKMCSPLENDSSLDGFVAGKRKRKPPGEWWLSHGLDVEGNAVEAQAVDTIKINPHGEVERSRKKKTEPGLKANRKKAALTKLKTTAALSEQVENQEELQPLNFDPVLSNSLVSPLGEASITTGDVFIQAIFQAVKHLNIRSSSKMSSL